MYDRIQLITLLILILILNIRISKTKTVYIYLAYTWFLFLFGIWILYNYNIINNMVYLCLLLVYTILTYKYILNVGINKNSRMNNIMIVIILLLWLFYGILSKNNKNHMEVTNTPQMEPIEIINTPQMQPIEVTNTPQIQPIEVEIENQQFVNKLRRKVLNKKIDVLTDNEYLRLMYIESTNNDIHISNAIETILKANKENIVKLRGLYT